MTIEDVIRRLRVRFGRGRKSAKDKRRTGSADTIHSTRRPNSGMSASKSKSASAAILNSHQLHYSPDLYSSDLPADFDAPVRNGYASKATPSGTDYLPRTFKRNPSKKKNSFTPEISSRFGFGHSPQNNSAPVWTRRERRCEETTPEVSFEAVEEEAVWRRCADKVYEIPVTRRELEMPTTHFPADRSHSPVSDTDSKGRAYVGSPTNESGYGSGRTSGLELSLPSQDVSRYSSPVFSPVYGHKQARGRLFGSPKSMEVLNDPRAYEVPVLLETSFDDADIPTDGLLKPSLRIQSRREHAKSELQIRPSTRSKSAESSVRYLKRRVRETKYVTAVFESANGGITEMLDDVLKEFALWLGEKSTLLGIAVEVHWSVPEKLRSRVVEIKLKDGLHRELRNNNRRVLNLYEGCREHLPSGFIESKIEENCARNKNVNAFQGIYRRFYPELFALQDKRTVKSHSTYWTFENLGDETKALPNPNPGRFLFNGPADQLTKRSIVAINLATLRLDDSDLSPNQEDSRTPRTRSPTREVTQTEEVSDGKLVYQETIDL